MIKIKYKSWELPCLVVGMGYSCLVLESLFFWGDTSLIKTDTIVVVSSMYCSFCTLNMHSFIIIPLEIETIII